MFRGSSVPHGTSCRKTSYSRAKARWKREAEEDPKAKREFRLAVAQKVARISGGNVQGAMEELLGPNPRNDHSKERFVSAYVAYKLRNVDDETRRQYAKKIGGMGDYRRDMAREAAVLWKNRWGNAGRALWCIVRYNLLG